MKKSVMVITWLSILLTFMSGLFISCRKTARTQCDYYNASPVYQDRMIGGLRAGGGEPQARVARQGVLGIISGLVKGKAVASGDGFGKGGFTAGAGTRQPQQNIPDRAVVLSNQMLIKKAVVRFEVKKYEEYKKSVATQVLACSAYVAQENENRDECRISANMTIRVASSAFDNLLDFLTAGAKKLESKDITVEDVTEEYVDLETRLKAKRQVETRYLDILKKAFTVEDILKVEENLGSIRENIESSEGRLKYLSNKVQFSTIDLVFFEQLKAPAQPKYPFLSQVTEAFGSGWDGLVNFFLTVLSAWPVWIILGCVSYAVMRIIRHFIKKHTADLNREQTP